MGPMLHRSTKCLPWVRLSRKRLVTLRGCQGAGETREECGRSKDRRQGSSASLACLKAGVTRKQVSLGNKCLGDAENKSVRGFLSVSQPRVVRCSVSWSPIQMSAPRDAATMGSQVGFILRMTVVLLCQLLYLVSTVFCVGLTFQSQLFSLLKSKFKTNFYLVISASFKIALGHD